MNRRTFVSLAGLLALAGCTSSTDPSEIRRQTEETHPGGLIAEDISTTPDDAMVLDATSGQLASLEAVQTVVSRATRPDEAYALIRLDSETLAVVEDALDSLPEYRGRSGPSGYYLNYNGDTVVVYPFYTNR
jgi:hypothetical protein